MNRSLLNILLLTALLPIRSNAQSEPLTVEVAATVYEYVPVSTTISHPGRAYTNCLGATSYFASFHSYGDFGSISGTADTNTNCATTFTLPRQTTFTSYRRVNYTIARDDHALYLLSCTQTWKPSRAAHGLAALQGVLGAGSHQDQAETQEKQAKVLAARGAWSECPAFVISHKYVLVINSASDVRIQNGNGDETQKSRKPVKMEYLGSAPLPLSGVAAVPLPETQTGNATTSGRVHITSSPNGGEIYFDGKFFGNTPADITLATGEHTIKVTLAGKEWSRTAQITAGETNIHAELPVGNSIDGNTKLEVDERGQAALNQLHLIAQRIKNCPRSAEWLDARGAGTIYDGPPSNVVWDVEPSTSARAAYLGYIEFSLPREFLAPDRKCEKEPGYCAEMMTATKPFEYRYEFDLGPQGISLTKLLVKSESAGYKEWSAARPDDSCWQKAAQTQ